MPWETTVPWPRIRSQFSNRVLKKAKTHLLTRTAQYRDYVFAGVYRATTVRELASKSLFHHPAKGLGSLPTVRLERRIGRISAEIMERLKDALAFVLDLYRNSE